ncbi:MAG: TorF family putative porin [Pseudomonadota bacterium]
MIKFKNIALATSIASIGFASASALAADAPASPHTLTANVGLYSQYVFRGLAQTNEEAALQGGFDYAHASGFYLGVWGSNVSWLKENATSSTGTVGGTYASGGTLELDFYGGYKGSVGDFGYDVGLLQYYYPGDVTGTNIKANTLEAYVAGSWKWFSVKYSHALSSDVFGVKDARGTSYLDLSASVPVGETGLTLGAHYGIQKYDGRDTRNTNSDTNDNLYSYDDWKISAAYDMGKIGKTFDGMTVGIAYTDTSSAHVCGYGRFSQTATANGASCNGVFPKDVADGKTTVWISKTF